MHSRGHGTCQAPRWRVLDRTASEIVHQAHHRTHAHLDVLNVFLDIDLRLPLSIQLQALQDSHETFGLCDALSLAHEPVAAGSQSLQLSLVTCDELVHTKQLD